MIDFDTVADDGECVTLHLPSKMEVCWRCHGRGTHVNPNVDGNGLTREDMDELGPDFEADYFGGLYDVVCQTCEGRNVIEVVDEERSDAGDLRLWREQLDANAEVEAMYAAERAVGA